MATFHHQVNIGPGGFARTTGLFYSNLTYGTAYGCLLSRAVMGQHASLYKTKAWYRLRHAQLQREPLCRMCKQLGRVTAANVIDHIEPHRGNLELFHDPANLQSLCKACHDGAKQSQERTGQLRGGDTEGRPIDPNHHWNA